MKHKSGTMFTVTVQRATATATATKKILYLVKTTGDVILQHFARWKGGDGEPKMFFKGVVGKLQTFFGAIAPQMAVHGVVHGLPIRRRTGAPRVVPVVMGLQSGGASWNVEVKTVVLEQGVVVV
jgi:hypothetical protein